MAMHDRYSDLCQKIFTMAWNIDADLKRVGENLRNLRNSRGLSIDTVAKAVQLSPQLLHQLEEGAYPECKLETLFDLIDYYGVSGEEVFGSR
jgi:DNA-binding XRE family transcriptional regulator